MNAISYFIRRAGACTVVCVLVLVNLTGALGANPIPAENALQGNPASEWDISGYGDPSIQGFATDISVNKGETIYFKVDTDARAYRIDIYRLGYYRGLGARRVDRVLPSVALPQIQPDPISDPATGLVDCGNWAVSASWKVPATAVSGVYIAKLVRTDTGGASHIVFVVRDDAGGSDLVLQTSDTTWQAYNKYGGNSLYVGAPAGRAYKVSYNRPFITRAGDTSWDWLFSAEYPMIRWLEANGYNVSYTTGVDTERRGHLLTSHKLFISVGHDEYWSGSQRANVEAARDAGVHLSFFSGNEVFWKTRWEPAIDGSGTPYRTMVCYKETLAGAKIDPTPTWTGTWRDPRFSPPSDGGRPENALLGTIFKVNGFRADSITVPAAFGAHRFWRDTSVATLGSGQVATFPKGTLGYEWDESPQDNFQPSGLMWLSSTTVDRVPLLQDYGATYASGRATHRLSLYRHRSGALVFGAGTVQWSWGLDSVHDNTAVATDPRMQQATVNLFADMGVFPDTLQAGLTRATQSTDFAAPVTTIQSPSAGATVETGTPVTITGTAVDTGGKVWGVEVSADGGATWQPASGLGNWSFAWIPTTAGTASIKSRAIDDSGNMETPSSGVTVTITGPSTVSAWPATTVPQVADVGADSPVELGVKFRSDAAGQISGVRFYKAAGNTGTHVGSLWSSTGVRLASATFIAETASGWQQVKFNPPVSISANTVYVASYHCPAGHYSEDVNYFAGSGVDRGPIHLPASSVSGGNGVYAYGPAGTFPKSTWQASNYWVDVVFEVTPTSAPTSLAVSPSNPSVQSGATQQFSATATYANGSTQDLSSQVSWSSSNTSVATINASGMATAVGAGTATIRATSGSVSGTTTLTVQTAPLSISTTSLPAGVVDADYTATLTASGGTSPRSWSLAAGSLPPGLTLEAASGVLQGKPTSTGTFSFSVQVRDSSAPAQTATQALSISVASTASAWPAATVPQVTDAGADKPVELGVKFRSDVAGQISGVRFYKAAGNTGTHVGSLWSSTGVRLASATFIAETASGWQQVKFNPPVSISANTVYVASYHCPAGHYSEDVNYFAGSGVDRGPIHLPASSVSGGNGVYAYGPAGTFPKSTWQASNYWVDVVFEVTPTSAPTSLAVSPSNPSVQSGATQQFSATATYANGSTQDLSSQVSWSSSNTSVATINASGMATAVGAGTATIRATSGSVSGTTTLTVQTAPLSISTTSLPAGVVDADYTATLTASGGTSPRSWSLAAGSLPPGLTLEAASGVLQGKPTSTGTFSFSVQVRDSSAPAQTATQALSISVASTASAWPAATVPQVTDAGADKPVELGVKFRSDVAGQISGVRFYKAAGNTGTHVGSLWSSTGVRLASATFIAETASGWQQVKFNPPVSISANTVYVASYHCPAGHYSEDVNYFAGSGVDRGPIHLPASSVSGGNGVYAYGPAGTFPKSTWQASNYWVDVVFEATPTSAPTSLAVSPSNPSVQSGATQQFSATATYANGSTQDLTSQVSWSSRQLFLRSMRRQLERKGTDSSISRKAGECIYVAGAPDAGVRRSGRRRAGLSIAGDQEQIC